MGRYQPYSEGVYALNFVSARLGTWIVEVERHTYFQLPVTYRKDRRVPELCYSYVELTVIKVEEDFRPHDTELDLVMRGS